MASEIRVLTEQEYAEYVRIQGVAYPMSGVFTDEARQRALERMVRDQADDPRVKPYGLFRKSQMVGVMSLFDFDMTLLSAHVPCGGVGSVAVDLTRKKEHAALDLISYFVQHYRDRKAPIAVLYPFRPDFYHKMGFGYGTRIGQYRVKPANLPNCRSKQHICYMTKADVPALLEFHNRYAARTNGMMQAVRFEFDRTFEGESVVVGYRDGEGIKGYMFLRFKKGKDDSPLQNHIIVRQLIAEREALPELLTFLHVQADQIDNIIFNWQDDHFYLVPTDPRNGSNHFLAPVYHETSAEGVGLMIRVLDVRAVFEALRNHDFGGVSAVVKLRLRDTLVKENDGDWVVSFDHGLPTLLSDAEHRADVTVSMDIAEFSSLLVGAVDFGSLYRYHMAEISDVSKVSLVSRIFHTDERPKCITMF